MELLILLFILALYLVIVILALSLVMSSLSMIYSPKKSAPFAPVNKHFVRNIVNALDVKDGEVMYELGAGDGRIVTACYKENPRATYIGIEKNLLPYLLARYSLLGLPKGHAVSMRKQNIFSTDLGEATCLFAYLLPGTMDTLLPKCERELKPGTRLISLQFPFTHKKADKIIEFPPSETGGYARRIFVYSF
jgi:precorrin-6B methylase 2